MGLKLPKYMTSVDDQLLSETSSNEPFGTEACILLLFFATLLL